MKTFIASTHAELFVIGQPIISGLIDAVVDNDLAGIDKCKTDAQALIIQNAAKQGDIQVGLGWFKRSFYKVLEEGGYFPSLTRFAGVQS
jgi:hypothetical protein